MKMTTKLLATVAALGALATATYSYAQPDATSTASQAVMANAQAGFEEMMNARFEGLGRMLTLKDNQKAAWDAYVKASKGLHLNQMPTYDKPAVDTQERLERRLARSQARTEQIKAFTDARAALLKVLEPSQKYVLEEMEARHGRMPGQGMGFHHGAMMGGYGPHMMGGYGPHMMMNGYGPNPNCPMAQ